MEEQVIVIQPGQEKVIRIRCGVEEATEVLNNAPDNDGVPNDDGAPAVIPAGISITGVPVNNNAPPISTTGVPVNNNNSNNGLSEDSENNVSGEGRNMARERRNRKTRKNRKQNGATRKNRKQSGGNAYMNFAKEERKRVLNDHPELRSNVVAVARKIGEAWRKLPEAERKKF